MQNVINRIYKPPSTATVTPIDQGALLSAMLANSGPQQEKASAFSPGAPIAPTPGITLPSGPRTWTFPIGYNIGQLPRATEATSFDTLRNLSGLYDAIMLCKQSWFDLCSRLDLEVKPTPDALEAANGDASVYAKDITKYKTFFETPDPDEDLDLHNWLIKALGEQLDLDALAIYVQPNRGGGVYGLNIISGDTIKPLINDRGRKPIAPYPAYQQFWHGAPLGWYTSDQIIYHRETQRADSVYGLSRVERIILRVNQALRKQNKDLSYYTEGNLPAGILEMPETDTNDWTPDEVLTFQKIWDGLLSGNDKTRSRLKVVPPGAKFTAVENQDDLSVKFDMFLLNTTVAAFGLTMAELGFTENVNKSSGDSQENVTYRRAMRPLMNRYAKLFTFILRKYFKETRFFVSFKGFEETEDLKTQSDAYGNLIAKGSLTIQDANRLMGLPYEEKEPIPRFVLTATGPVFFEDLLDPELRTAAKQAKLTGFQQAAQPPEQTNQGSEDNPKNAQSAPHTQNTPSSHTSTNAVDKTANNQKNGGTPGKAPAGASETRRATEPAEASADYRRWREVAISAVKAGKVMRPFTSEHIPRDAASKISYALDMCRTVEDVKRVFELERATATDPTLEYDPKADVWQGDDTEQRLAKLREQGVTHLTWKTYSGTCDVCGQNDLVTVEVGSRFPNGSLLPPVHPNCACTTESLTKNAH